MFCPSCGKESNESGNYCKFCGGQLTVTASVVKKSEKKSKKFKAILSTVIGIVVGIVAFIVVYYLVREGTSTLLDNTSKQDLINETVNQVKNETTFPNELDSVTTWMDIIAESDSVRYVYVIHDADLSQVSNESLKNNLTPAACQDKDIRNILNQGINLEFFYSVKNSTQTFFTSVSQGDCN